MSTNTSELSQYNKFISRLNVILFSLIIVGSCALVGVHLSRNNAFMNTLVLATTVQPETFTELYFQNHLELPNKINPGEQYSFAFTIHNLENKDMEYPYEVTIDFGDRKIQLDKNSVTVKKDASLTIQQGFLLQERIDRAQVVVHLIDKDQQIHFWVEGNSITQ